MSGWKGLKIQHFFLRWEETPLLPDLLKNRNNICPAWWIGGVRCRLKGWRFGVMLDRRAMQTELGWHAA
jgi:hypothetical protein